MKSLYKLNSSIQNKWSTRFFVTVFIFAFHIHSLFLGYTVKFYTKCPPKHREIILNKIHLNVQST